MEQKIIKLLDSNLECTDCRIKDNKIIMDIQSMQKQAECPFCKVSSDKIHSVYQREIQDIPLHGRQTILLLKTRKMFCFNPECCHKTFSEPFEFVSPKSKKTKRLINKIRMTSVKLSSVSASALLKNEGVQVSKTTICEMLKKNPGHCGEKQNHQNLCG